MEMKFKRWASNCSQFSSSQYEHCLRRGHTVEKMGLRNMFGELSVISHMIGAIENQELAASNVLCPNQVGVRDR